MDSTVPGTFVSYNELLVRSKSLLQAQSSSVLRLNGWLNFFQMVPLEIPQLEKIFHQMILSCKITKFKEVNYKILTQILLTPKLLSKMKSNPDLSKCSWCGLKASLEHLLLLYPFTKLLHALVVHIAFAGEGIAQRNWIFGVSCQERNLFIWLNNFTVYKCHL